MKNEIETTGEFQISGPAWDRLRQAWQTEHEGFGMEFLDSAETRVSGGVHADLIVITPDGTFVGYWSKGGWQIRPYP